MLYRERLCLQTERPPQNEIYFSESLIWLGQSVVPVLFLAHCYDGDEVREEAEDQRQQEQGG